MKIINLTPHTINILLPEGSKVIEPSGIVARCKVTREKTGEIEGIPVFSTVFGEVEDLPPSKKDTIYIVSSLVAQASRVRDDLFIPDDLVRDEQGRIIGCKGLTKI